MPSENGHVFWVTGLAGAGKTTIGNLLAKTLRSHDEPVVHLDGDMMRDIFQPNNSFTLDTRAKLAQQYSKLCKLISEQGVTVVCSTISMFHAIHGWNRENISKYHEIYLKVPFDELEKRDQKKLYSRAKAGDKIQVIGIDSAFEEPLAPKITIENDGRYQPNEIVDIILAEIGVIKNNSGKGFLSK